MRFARLGSGSEGNGLLVEAASCTTTTRILLDCGFSAKEAQRRLERLGCRAEDLDAIVITHEHTDHIGSALTLARKWSIPLYMSWGKARAVGEDEADVDLQVLWGNENIAIGDLSVLPYNSARAAAIRVLGRRMQARRADGCRGVDAAISPAY